MYLKLFTVLLAATTRVYSFPALPERQDYFTGFIQKLNQQGLTTLGALLTQYGTTQQGQQLASTLSSGNYTVLAPSNGVCSGFQFELV